MYNEDTMIHDSELDEVFGMEDEDMDEDMDAEEEEEDTDEDEE